MKNENTGPQFLKTMIPIIDELKLRNGSGKSNEVIEKVIEKLDIKDEKMFEKYKSGQTRIYNQICWARNYLVEAGYISKEKRGIWELTEKGLKSNITEKDLISLFKSVQNKFKNKNEDVDFEEEIAEEPKEEIENIYTKENALSELFIEPEKFDIILNTLKRKKNIILQGSPGVGKTFFAKRLAYTLIGLKDKGKLNMVQFHQSYSYEDFMQGFRPTEEGKFVLKNGVFYEFCQKAIKDIENSYVFIIDEINRGNLSKIFGELMMLIEKDKRGKEFSIPLTYSKDENEAFYVPENVHIIGTMNTADRSLAIVDYALRRRFSFIDIEPAYNKQRFSDYLEKNGISKELIERINLKLGNLNQIIEKDNRLGKGFRIGHSYFSGNIESENQTEWYKSIIQTEITPLIFEYWFDDETQAVGHIEKLMEI